MSYDNTELQSYHLSRLTLMVMIMTLQKNFCSLSWQWPFYFKLLICSDVVLVKEFSKKKYLKIHRNNQLENQRRLL